MVREGQPRNQNDPRFGKALSKEHQANIKAARLKQEREKRIRQGRPRPGDHRR